MVLSISTLMPECSSTFCLLLGCLSGLLVAGRQTSIFGWSSVGLSDILVAGRRVCVCVGYADGLRLVVVARFAVHIGGFQGFTEWL